MTAKHGHLNSLDSIRGIAALVVIFSHVFLAYYPEIHSGAEPAYSELALSVFHTPFTFFYRGQFAVLLFFILSGYVLTLGCVRKAFSNPDYIAIAASKRYLRLGIPTAASVLICYVAVVLGLVPVIGDGITPKLMDMPAQDLQLTSAVASALYKSMLFGDQTFNYVLWTIKIEFYGSLLIFATFALVGRNRALHMAVCGALFLYLQTRAIYVNMYSYFFLGALLARVDFSALQARAYNPAAIVALLAAGCYLGGYHESSAAYLWLAPLSESLGQWATQANIQVVYNGIGAALVIVAVLLARSGGLLNRCLNTRPLLMLGKLSFSVYLLHPIVLSSLGKSVYIEMGRTAASALVCLAAVIGATSLLSVFFYRYVDRPSIRWSDSFGRALFSTSPQGMESGQTGRERVAFQPT